MQSHYSTDEEYSPDKELTRIDCGISQLSNLPLISSLTVLNLHYNNIREIRGLEQLRKLKHLDLSSNLLEKIEGLDHLICLRTLNLASNRITVVEGLQKLTNLVKLNLAYNQIHELSGFLTMQGPRFHLSNIEIQGNQIRSPAIILRCMKSLVNLRRLTVASGHQKNPLCSVKNYEQLLFTGLPQLDILDGKDRRGKDVEIDILADIPGLDEFLDLFSSNGSSVHIKETSSIPTPKVNAAREMYKKRVELEDSSTQDLKPLPAKGQPRSTSSQRNPVPSEGIIQKPHQVNQRETSRPQEVVQTKVAAINFTQSDNESGNAGEEMHVKKDKAMREDHLEKKRDLTTTIDESENFPKASKKSARITTSGNRVANGIEMTFGQLLRELDSERERRWKAEEACRRLSEHFKALQQKVSEDTTVQSAALSATANLRENLMQEKERSRKLSDECKVLQDQVVALQDEKKQHLNDLEKTRVSLAAHEKLNDENTAHYVSKLRHMEAQLESSDHLLRQLKADTSNQREEKERLLSEIKDLQSLLVNKEKEFQHELERRYTIDSPQLQEYINRQVASSEQQASVRSQFLERSITEWQQKYKLLEDEFRMALKIEANRYENIQKNYKNLKTNYEKTSQELQKTIQREADGKEMVTELAQLVKEQKTKLSEVTNVKTEMDRLYKERVGTLELHLEEARKRMLQLEMLKQENKRLLGQIEAQESVIEGLRSERKLWSEELAQQGAALAQDRGRLESKIETLQSEVMTLKINLERETDNVKIKAKLIEDQTEAIRKLKEAITEKDNYIKKLQSETLQSHGYIEKELQEQKKLNEDFRTRLVDSVERKEALKLEMEELQRELGASQTAYEALHRKHRERAALIDKLESQTMELKNVMEEKATRLSSERDAAVNEAKSLEKKLSQMDHAFREQLKALEFSKIEAVNSAKREVNAELQKSQLRVREVEQEMRELLLETQQSKKLLEEKVYRLTSAFQDLSGDLRR